MTNQPSDAAKGLLPCPNPWCPSTTPALPTRSTYAENAWRVKCACGVMTNRQDSEAEAITAWNTRADRHLTPSEPVGCRRFRHKKRGTEYTLIGVGHAQGTLADEDMVVLYRGDDGGLWVRHYVEFTDGRFEELATPPATVNSDAIPELSLPYELKALSGDHIADAGNMVSDAGLVGRIDYILDPTASASERMQRRSHLTNHDLRTIRAALSAIPTPAVNAELVEACKVLLAGHHALNNSDISASEISCINGLPTDDQLESARAAIAKATGQQVPA